MSHVNHRRPVPKRKNPVARDLRTPKYRMRVEEKRGRGWKGGYQEEGYHGME